MQTICYLCELKTINNVVNKALNKEESKDYIDFKESLKQLHDNLLRDYVYDNNSIVIALSRKGPKVIDLAFTEDELSNFNIVTEFAIPFLLKTLQPGVEYRIYVVDDAIYFGSTLKNLISEIREYEERYKLKFTIRTYVALQDKEALKFSDVEVNGMIGYRSGYGHYFVRQLMAGCRSQHRCMEVEFPIITCEFTEKIDLQRIAIVLDKEYKTVYANDYAEEKVVTVLLHEDGCQFCKIRIYGEEKKLHIAFMAPRNIAGGIDSLQHLMDGFNPEYRKLWDLLLYHLYGDKQLWSPADRLNRNRERSLVVLANYIYSYHLFVGIRRLLEQQFRNLGYVINAFYLQKNSIYRLTGVHSIEDELKRLLSYDMRVVDEHRPDVNIYAPVMPSQFYEEEDSPTLEERNSLAEHNLHMVRNCMNMQQALSAIVFNQNLFVERWSRNGNEGSRRHLWFGYTHETLGALVDRYARFDSTDTQNKDIHQWLDGRIDMGCVVPQYIRDWKSNIWVRVFRPGENEDIFLSHLARFVIHLYGAIDNNLHLGYCPREILGKVLAIVWIEYYEDILKQQFDFKLKVEDGELFLSQDKLPTRLTVIRYLQKMYILNINNDGEITISPRIADPDFLHHTTLDKHAEEIIDRFVDMMFEQMKEWDVDVYSSYSYFNHYLNKDVDTGELKTTAKKAALDLKTVLEQVEIGLSVHPEKPLADNMKDRVLDIFYQIRKYDEHPNFYINNVKTETEYWYQYKTDPRIKVQHDFKAMYQIMNLIVGVYILNSEKTVNYLKSDAAKTAMTMLRMGTLRAYLEKVEKEDNYKELRYSTTMPGLMKGILDEIIKS